MFEIPDDDDNFWNDDPLEEDILSKPGALTGKENRPQLRVPDSACTGNPAKRLCTDFSRDVTLPVQAEVRKELSSAASVNDHSDSVLVKKTLPSISSQQSNTTVLNTCTQNVHLAQSKHTVVNSDANVSVQKSNSPAFSDAPFHIPFPTDTSHSRDNDSRHYEGANTCSLTKHTVGSVTSVAGSIKNNSGIHNVKNDRKISEQPKFSSDACEAHPNKETGIIQRETSSVSGSTRRRSRSNENEAGDHVTPHRKRKFPGPAGILPKLGPGRNFDIMSPTSLNTSSPVSNKSPKDDNIILCSQQTDDIFNDSPWQRLITDLGEEGQTLLKKFSISSTLLKSGKKQLVQGKAALIFGIIESIESHGSEASVTIRDRSGRMQGTIHRDLLKEHEADLQAGTVLVLKQVSIISLSNRNHYLNITPSNVVVLYRGGEGSLRSLKFHGSVDSLHSVLSALEKKAAAQYNNLNSSVNMTPSSHTGSRRLGSSSGTPQQYGASPLTGPGRYGASPISPVTNQRLFSPRTPVLGQSEGIRTPTPSNVRNVSVVDRNVEHINNNRNNFTPNFTNTNSVSRLNTPSISESNSTFFSTPNTDFKVVPLQDNTSLSYQSANSNFSNNNNTNSMENASIGLEQTYKIAQNLHARTAPVLNTPNSVGKSKWKFKSPPGRTGSLPSSPDISKIPANTAINSRIPAVYGINSSTKSDTGAVNYVKGTDTIKTSPSVVGGGTTINSGKASVWSFKMNNSEKNLPCKTGKAVTQVNDENLWEDDMDDDILSQLSEDFT